MTLQIQPLKLREAQNYVNEHHRHHKAPQGGLFAIGVNDGQKIVGVIIVGRPVATWKDKVYLAEVTRCCTDGTKNACSMLYAAAWRAARAMGYRRLITYTLVSERGTSLKAAGWRVVGTTRKEKSWNMPSRPRIDKHPTGQKTLWEMSEV